MNRLQGAYRIPASPAHKGAPSNHGIRIGAAGAGHEVEVGDEKCYQVNDHQPKLQQDQYISPVPSVLPAECLSS